MVNSAEHEILSAHKYKNTKKFDFFQAQISLKCLFLLINVKLLAFEHLWAAKSWVEHETSGAWIRFPEIFGFSILQNLNKQAFTFFL